MTGPVPAQDERAALDRMFNESALERLIRASVEYLREHGHYVPGLSRLVQYLRDDVTVLRAQLAETQQELAKRRALTDQYARYFVEAGREGDKARASLAATTKALEEARGWVADGVCRYEDEDATGSAGYQFGRDLLLRIDAALSAAGAAPAGEEATLDETVEYIRSGKWPEGKRRWSRETWAAAITRCQDEGVLTAPAHDCAEHTVSGEEGTAFCARCEQEARAEDAPAGEHGLAGPSTFEPGRGYVRRCACGREFTSESWAHVPALFDHVATSNETHGGRGGRHPRPGRARGRTGARNRLADPARQGGGRRRVAGAVAARGRPDGFRVHGFARWPRATGDGTMSERRYEISILIGPCRESEAETLCLELAEQLRGQCGEMGSELGASLAVGPWDEIAPGAER